MTAGQPAYVCDEAEARELTEQIKGSVEKTWRLLLNAHEWKAWAALGYGSWRDYATSEFGISQSRAYQLLDAAKVVREIEGAAGFQVPGITSEAAGDLKPHLDKVTEAVATAVADVPEDERPAAAAAAVKTAREQYRPQPSPPAVSEPAGTTGPTAPAGGEPHVPNLTGVELTAEQYQAKVTSLGQTAPVEQWQETTQLDDELEARLSGTDERFLLNLARGMAACNALLRLSPERAVQTCPDGSNEHAVLIGFLDDMNAWTASVRAGLKPALRRIK